MQIVGRGGAGVVGLGHRVLHQPHGRLLQIAERGLRWRHKRLHRFVARMMREQFTRILEIGHDRAAAVARQLAADEVERLHAVRALVDHGDAGVAHELLHAPFAHIAVAAEHLLRLHRIVKTNVGEHALEHGREEAEPVFRGLTLGRVLRAMRDIAVDRRRKREAARGLVERLDLEQHAPHVGMHDDRIGALAGVFRARQRTALQAVFGVGERVLIGDLRLRETLHGDAEPRLVHHHEHGVQPAIRLADKKALRAVVIHHAGRICVNAHFLFDRAAGDAVARAERPVVIDQKFRHDEERDALHAGGRALDPREHQVDDVLGQIMFARGNENLLPGDGIGAVRARDRFRGEKPQIRAALRLGQIHRAGPAPFRHLRRIEVFLLRRTMAQERGERALSQPRIHGESHIRRRGEFIHRRRERVGQALAAIFLRNGKADPAAIRERLIGGLEAGGGRHGRVIMASAACLVARLVQRVQNFLAKLSGFGENLRHDVGGQVRETRQIAETLEIQHVIQEENRIVDRRLIAWHERLLENPRGESRRCAGRVIGR